MKIHDWMKNRKLAIAYQIVMALLAFLSVLIALLDLTGHISTVFSDYWYYGDMGILIVFAIDYFARFYLAKDKKEFFIRNFFDLIAIIPFNAFFRAFRFARFLRFLRLLQILKLFVFLKRFASKIDRFTRVNGFIYVLYMTISTTLLGAVGIYIVEPGDTVASIWDALWCSFVTVTTVGYGDISPSTHLGRLIAAVLMLMGIGFIGMLTGTIATYFMSRKKPVVLQNIDFSAVDLSDLSEDEFHEVMDFVAFLRSKRD